MTGHLRPHPPRRNTQEWLLSGSVGFMEGLGVPLCCRHPEIFNLQKALHFYCTLGPVNYVARAIPRPSQKLQQQDSCSYAPTGVGRYTCYSRVTKTGFCPGWDQHGSPFPFLLSAGLPKHSVSSRHSFLVQSFFKATTWQRDREGSSSVSYPIPFFPPPPSFPSSPGLLFSLAGLQAGV